MSALQGGSISEFWRVHYGVPDWLAKYLPVNEESTWVVGKIVIASQLRQPQLVRYSFPMESMDLSLVLDTSAGGFLPGDWRFRFTEDSLAGARPRYGDPHGYAVTRVALGTEPSTIIDGCASLQVTWTLKSLPVPCPPYTYAAGGACAPCPAGTASPANATSVFACAPLALAAAPAAAPPSLAPCACTRSVAAVVELSGSGSSGTLGAGASAALGAGAGAAVLAVLVMAAAAARAEGGAAGAAAGAKAAAAAAAAAPQWLPQPLHQQHPQLHVRRAE